MRNKLKKTLIIQLERLGDLIQTTPFLSEYRTFFTDEEIHLLVLRETCEAIEGFHAVDQIHPLAQKKVTEFNSKINSNKTQAHPEAEALLKELRLDNFDKLINFTHDAFGCWLAHRIKASCKEGGLLTEKGEWLWQGDWHAYLIAVPDFRDRNYFNLVDIYRGAGPSATVRLDQHGYVATSQDNSIQLPKGKLVALNPGASRVERCWPSSNFSALANLLSENGFQPILVGSPKDVEICEDVQRNAKKRLTCFAGKTSIKEMAYILAKCYLLISNDTGAIHMASAVDTRCIGLYGATAFFRETAPWGEGHMILQAPLDRDLAGITVTDVFVTFMGIQQATPNISLQSKEITLWKTSFLDSDPLGGLQYKRIDSYQKFDGRFAQHMRTAFSKVLLGCEAGEPGPPTHQYEIDGLAAVEVLVTLGAMSQDLLQAYEEEFSENIQLIEQISSAIQLGKQELIKAVSSTPHIAPPIYWLDWVLKTFPTNEPKKVFEIHIDSFKKTADIIRETIRLNQVPSHR